MAPIALKLEMASPAFFATPLTKLTVEENRGTGRTYILDKRGRVLAVAKPKEVPDGR